MDMITLKARAKEKKDQAVVFVRHHWKPLLVGTITAVVVVVVVWRHLSSQPSDEENENVFDEDDDNFVSNSHVEIGESRDSQTHIQKDHPKRFIGEIDATGSRLRGNQKQGLEELSAQWDRFKGKEQTVESKFTDFSSDGKYTRYTKTKHSFGDDKMSITVEESYEDDDGQTGSRSSTVELKARNIINYFRGNRHLKMFDDVRDIVDLL